MKSVKPGRGPSFLGGISGIAVGAFGVIWTMGARSIGAPDFFTAFGIVFVLLAIGSAVYHLFNATSKKRFSAFDITDSHEEPDPLNEAFGKERQAEYIEDIGETEFCPYCGTRAEDGYRYCRKCGKELPKGE